jgi:DNA sulfur modification protein DndD
MILKRLSVSNYSLFHSASFDLSTTPECPVVLFCGNNGAGKTSLLDALRLVFHGRRSLLGSPSETEYWDMIRAKFHNGNLGKPCSVQLSLSYSEFGALHRVDIMRSWSCRGSRTTERLDAALDGTALPTEEAEDLLVNIAPPEVLRYFFFDGERIKELAEWHGDDDEALFAAIDQLLGLDVIEQLNLDLERVLLRARGEGADSTVAKLETDLLETKQELQLAQNELKTQRVALRACSRQYDELRQRFLATGGLAAEECEALKLKIKELRKRAEELLEFLRREAAAFVPLLLMRRTRVALLSSIELASKVETAEALAKVLKDSRIHIEGILRTAGLAKERATKVAEQITTRLLPRPVALPNRTPSLSLREASWMRSIIEVELARIREDVAAAVRSYHLTMSELQRCERQLESTRPGDQRVDKLLAELELKHKEMITLQHDVQVKEQAVQAIAQEVAQLETQLKRSRQREFEHRRLERRDILVAAVREALPEYAAALRVSKQNQFARELVTALKILWHKRHRVSDAEVDLARRCVRLFNGATELDRSQLSAAEKQLFATAFIGAVSKLANRSLPFVIDTPVGRLDTRHRWNLVLKFLPKLSHQVILFSTDTEITGSLLRGLRPLVAKEYELADFNGGVTEPVQLEVAL